MVLIPAPPPKHPPHPLYRNIPAGTRLIRLFDPTNHGATQLSFRTYGPLHRFDHQRYAGKLRIARDDPGRGIYYAAFTLSSCIVEVFGDTGVMTFGNWHVARVTVSSSLHLLDLTGSGAMRAGSVAALSKIPSRSLTQKWSRFIYDNPAIYSEVDGLLFFNAHNDEEALALYERAASKLRCPDNDVVRLDAPGLTTRLQAIASENNLIIDQ